MFEDFGKIARFNREICVTEKIDGTNAQVLIQPCVGGGDELLVTGDGTAVYAGSRTRWVTREDDNFGWAKWVWDNADELIAGLGIGRHFGEWWGNKIQRGYGLDHKRFSLFNTGVWNESTKPECCHVVPVLYRGLMEDFDVQSQLQQLRDGGSVAAPGFMNPEGLVIYHVAAKTYFKKTLTKDEEWKGKVA
jgi:hypothetical protein